MNNDVLNEQSLRKHIKDDFLRIAVWEQLDSTNQQAKRMLADGERETTLLVALQQTNGRGRMGRSFYSPADTGVYFSILYTPKASVQSAVSVTGAAAVAVMRAIRKVTGLQTGIKWVNDLYYRQKKVCGVLAESVYDPATKRLHVILGIGINLRTEDFPAELAQKAGSLSTSVSRAELIAAVWHELYRFLCDPTDSSWLADYRACSTVIGKEIEWTQDGQTTLGVATGINGKGELLVRTQSGDDCVLRTGEISVRFLP